MTLLTLAVVAMLVQQSFAYMSGLVMPVAAPAVAADLGLDTALIGVFTGLMFFASMISQLSCGGFIIRYGPLRMSQVALLFMATGLLLIALGVPPIFAIAAMIIGTGTAPSTPASSQLLARYAPPRHAPLIFSIKQTGVPVGAMLAGLIVPFFATRFGWQSAFVVTGLMCLTLALALQPLRAEFDRERRPGHSLSPADVRDTLLTILRDGRLRGMAIAAFAFVGLQSVFASFFVVYLTEGLGRDFATAGYAFSLAQSVAIPARIAWGWAGSRFISPHLLLGLLGFAMAVASVGTGLYAPGWSLTAILAVAFLYSGTAVSWHGVLLAEVARLAPDGKVGALTGGVLSFGSAGMMSYPLVFSAILWATGSYAYGFFIAAVPALVAGALLLRRAG